MPPNSRIRSQTVSPLLGAGPHSRSRSGALHAGPVFLKQWGFALYGALLWTVIGALALFAPVAHADQLVENSINDNGLGNAAFGAVVQVIAPGSTGTVTDFTFRTDEPVYWANTQWPSGYATFTQCDSYSGAFDLSSEDASRCSGRVRHQADSISYSGEYVTLHWNTPIVLDSSKQYIFAYYGGDNGAPYDDGRVHLYGTEDTAAYPGSINEAYPNLVAIYWEAGIDSGDPGPGPGTPTWDGDDSSHIMRINAPTNFGTVASTTFDVSADIHLSASSTVNAVMFVLRKEEGGYYYSPTELFTNIGWDGTATDWTFDSVLTAAQTGTYQLTLRLATCNEFGGCVANGAGQAGVIFSVVEPDDAWDAYIPGYEDPTGVAEDCDINFLGTFSFSGCVSYLLVPRLDNLDIYRSLTLENAFPFSYVYQFDDIKNAIYSNPDLEASAISVDIEGFGEMTFLSRDMVAAVPFAPFIKDCLNALLWLLLAFALYKIVIRAHDKHTVV